MQDYSHLNQFGSLVEDFERVERGEVSIRGFAPSTTRGADHGNREAMVRIAYRQFREGLLQAQKFIGPDLGWKVLAKTGEVEEKHLAMVRLPFDDVAVLYEQEVETAGERGSASIVTLYQGGPHAGSTVTCRTAIRHPRAVKVDGRVPWMLWRTCIAIDPQESPHLRNLPGGVSRSRGRGLSRISFDMFHLESQLSAPVPEDPHLADRVGLVLVDLCCALACRNVVAREVAIPEKTALRRAKAGKRPLFSYKVLEIEAADADREPRMGLADRASPRTHLRRGHFRHLENDQLVWVNAALVRGQTPGIVVKDYRV